ncbi:MAG TPA: hypothetical protein VGG85_17155 [Terracidiphilus sp.]
MTSKTASRLILLYPRCWRKRYGREFAALLEEHPFSLKTLADVLWSAGEAHVQSAFSQEHNQSILIGWVWSAWMIAVVAGLILYGMVDDSRLLAAMGQNSIFAAGWKVIEVGCVLSVSAIAIAGLPLAASMCLYAVRERRRGVYLRLVIPFISVFALAAWVAVVLMFTGGHWAASPWAVAFSRPDWPSDSVRWITGSISAILLLFCCFASAAGVAHLVRGSQLPDVRIPFFPTSVHVKPISFAAALAPLAAAGMFVMLSGVVVWGCIASQLSVSAFRGLEGPLGLSGLASWILATVILGFAAAISAQAVWRGRTTAER